jgi:hypothetical protein
MGNEEGHCRIQGSRVEAEPLRFLRRRDIPGVHNLNTETGRLEPLGEVWPVDADMVLLAEKTPALGRVCDGRAGVGGFSQDRDEDHGPANEKRRRRRETRKRKPSDRRTSEDFATLHLLPPLYHEQAGR